MVKRTNKVEYVGTRGKHFPDVIHKVEELMEYDPELKGYYSEFALFHLVNINGFDITEDEFHKLCEEYEFASIEGKYSAEDVINYFWE